MGGNFALASGRQVLSAPRGGKDGGSPMSKTEHDYEVGRGKLPLHSRFKKGQSGSPRGPRPKACRREAVVTQLVNKSTGAGIAGGGGKAGAEISGPTRTLSYCSPAPAGADGKWRCDPLSHRG